MGRCIYAEFAKYVARRDEPPFAVKSLTNRAEDYVTSVGFENLLARRGGADRGTNSGTRP
jgi:hypothetical protein